MIIDLDPALHDPSAMRHASADLLSLALMQARNVTLQRLAPFALAEAAAPQVRRQPPSDLPWLSPPLWLAGHAGWFQEFWLARNVQRARGRGCTADGPRLASIEPQSDRWWHPRHSRPAQRWQLDLPGYDETRRWMADTLEVTLDLLASATSDDNALYLFREALQAEDRMAESLAVLAQALDVPVHPAASTLPGAAGSPDAGDPWPPAPSRTPRDPLWFAAQAWLLGSMPDGGATPDLECPAHEVRLPEFEIDAQPVHWAQFIEFVEDGGYDRPELWSAEGAAWLARHTGLHGPRSPRYVEQMRRGVAVRRHGRVQRAAVFQPVMHVTAHEAHAWCRWAGRRLPTEPEWELAASIGRSRGFVWGDAWEWMAGSARAYPGHVAGPLSLPLPPPGQLQVLRGCSWMSAPRQRHPKARRFVSAHRDDLFCGFRSCAL